MSGRVRLDTAVLWYHSTDMTSSYRRSSSSDSSDETVRPRQVRWEDEVYTSLKAFSAASHTSMNLIANEAVRSYLSQPEQQSKLQAALDEQAEAIRKLAGG